MDFTENIPQPRQRPNRFIKILATLMTRLTALIRDDLSRQRDRLIVWLPVFWGLGISLYFSLRFEPWPVFTGAAAAFTGALLIFVWPWRSAVRSSFYTGWLLTFALFLTVGGFSAAQFQTHNLGTVLLSEETGPATVTGTVESIERLEDGKGWRVVVSEPSIEDLSPEKTPERVRIKVWKARDIKAGDRISMLANINPPGPPVIPGAFDFQRYAYFQKLGGFGFSYTEPEILRKAQGSAWSRSLELWREKLSARIENTTDYPEAAILTALMTGKRASIAEEDWEALRRSGLAHMLAISGLHVGLIAGVCFFLTRLLLALFPKICLYHPVKKYAAVASFASALFYTLLVGATIPTIRALLMVGIVLLGVILDRTAISLRLVALAACAILILWPASLLGASFQMSFAAVTALVVFYQALRPYWSKWRRSAGPARRLSLYFLSVCLTTIVATLATAPFALFHFQRLALFGLLSNLIAVPIMAMMVMPLIVFAYILIPLNADYLVMKGLETGIALILQTAHDVASLPESSWLIPAMPFPGFVCLLLAGLILCLWRGYGRLAFLVPLTLGCLIFVYHVPPDILVSSDGKLMAFRHSDASLYVSSRRHNRFSSQVWLRRNGEEEDIKRKWAHEGYTPGTGMICGEMGCHLVQNGKHVAFSFHPSTLEEDCQWADILIAQDPVPQYRCKADIVIDRFDTWRNGSYALRTGDSVRHTAFNRGTRPWTVTNSR